MKNNHSLVLGKFMDFHKGHEALIRHAQTLSHKVTVLLCVTDDDRNSALLRKTWIERTFGNTINLLVIRPEHENLPLKEESDREVSCAWAKWIDEKLPDVDLVVGSEDYVGYMADYGTFEYCIFDKGRVAHSCSSTSVNEGDWDSRSLESKAMLHNRVYLVGPESTGKTISAEYLRDTLGYNIVLEQARDIMRADGSFCATDLKRFALSQELALLDALDTQESKVIVSDSSALTTKVYSDMTFGWTDPLVNYILECESTFQSLYLLFTPEVEWIDDGTRHMESLSLRWEFFNHTKDWLVKHNKPFKVVQGNDYQERLNQVLGFI